MSRDEADIEAIVRARGLKAPRITPADIDDLIIDEDYVRFEGTTLTVCCLHLRNGFTVVGQSAAASLENFDQELGEKIARADARDKIWPLAGYALRQKLYEESLAHG